jgi:predicted CopG family antitoxin
MSTVLSQTPPRSGLSGWLSRAEAWLDARGKPAWIVAMVVAFILAWPVGLALLAYMIWSQKMTCSARSTHNAPMRRSAPSFGARRSSGNSAFDAYREETLARLEQEQQSFEDFLARLRAARDKAEFDQFMEDRRRKAQSDSAAESTAEDDAPDLDAPKTT